MNSTSDQYTNSILSNLSNSSNSAFKDWDVTTGFMGSNTMKQGQLGVIGSITQIFSSLKTIASELFTENSPIFLVLGTLSILAGIVIIYVIYTFVRTGR